MGGMSSDNAYVRYMRIVKNSLLGAEDPPRAWPFFLGKKLECDVINFGSSGASNIEIFSKICKECHNISEGDLVIIEWSYNHRFRWVNEKTNQWAKFGIYMDPDPHGIINPGTHQDISINRSHEKYAEDIYDYEKIIDQLAKNVGFKVYYWSCDNNIIYRLPEELKSQKKYLISEMVESGKNAFDPIFKRGGKTIKEETNGKVNDYHFGESAHIIMADLFYSYIIENPL
jgi:hypothetical protein